MQDLRSYRPQNGHDVGRKRAGRGQEEGSSITSGTSDTTSTKKNAAPKGTPPNPDVKAFIDFAYETHLAATEKKLHVDGGKDGALVKKMLATYSLEDLQRYWKQYLEDNDDWIISRGYSIGKFKSAISCYVTGRQETKQRCAACNGTGEFSGETCPRCGGAGRC